MSSILQQIIRDMYIDPELLEQLGDEQKLILFRKIREEQIRRWQIKEKELEEVPPKKSTPRKIDFLLAADGKPWVWVMGEHEDDTPYEEIVKERELKKQEDEQLAEIVEAEKLTKTGIISVINEMENVSVRERRQKVGRSGTESPDLSFIRTESQLDTRAAAAKQQETTSKKRRPQRRSIMGDTLEERKKFEKEQVAEVLGTLRRTRSIAKKRAEEMAKRLEHTWRESQKRADMYERSRKRSFKMAKEMAAKSPNIHEKILDELPAEKKEAIIQKRKPARPAPPPPSRKKLLKMTSFVEADSAPKSAAHVVKWFKDVESPKGVGKEKDGSISVWFHGKIGRETAVKMLEDEPIGSFLVRLSPKLWGYTVSVKGKLLLTDNVVHFPGDMISGFDGTRHFLVDASSGQYNFLGPKQERFKSLPTLLEYYKINPITWDGQEILLLPVALEDERDVYGGLYSDSDEEEDGSQL